MDNFSELVKVRRSMRKFTDEKITTEEQRQLMRAALMAPSSKGLHSYEFVVVEDKHIIESLSKSKAMGADFLANAPLAIAVMADPAVSDVWVEDASVAATMLLLQAEDMGLGACWIQIRKRADEQGNDAEQNVRSILEVDESKRVLCIIAVGHKGMERKPQNEERLAWDKVKSNTMIF